jgi:hypothetical protein
VKIVSKCLCFLLSFVIALGISYILTNGFIESRRQAYKPIIFLQGLENIHYDGKTWISINNLPYYGLTAGVKDDNLHISAQGNGTWELVSIRLKDNANIMTYKNKIYVSKQYCTSLLKKYNNTDYESIGATSK